MSTHALQIPVTVAVVLGFYAFCTAQERRSRGVAVLFVLWGVALLDAVFYSDTDVDKMVSVFHPVIGGQNVRIEELLIPVAVLARLQYRGLPGRLDASGPLWSVFFGWVALSTVTGVMQGYQSGYVFRQAAMILYVGGSLALAAGTPIRDVVEDRTWTRFLVFAGVVGTLLFLTSEAHVRISTSGVPDLPLSGFGVFGPDAASMFPAVGILGAALELTRPRHLRRRVGVLVLCGLLVATHLATPQRASRLDLYVTLALLLVVALLPVRGRRRRLRVTGTEVTLVAAGVVGAVALVPTFVSAVQAALRGTQVAVTLPFSGQTATALNTTHRQGSVASRYNQWDVVRHLISQRPVTGWGLGKDFVHYEQGLHTFVVQDITHNIGLDLLYRMGAVGLALMLAAVLVVGYGGVRAWRRSDDPRVAAFAIAAFAVLVGLLARGMVESIFEKYRLAVMLGIVLGLLCSARASLPDGVHGPDGRVGSDAGAPTGGVPSTVAETGERVPVGAGID